MHKRPGKTPFHADHIGSLLRPVRLLDAREARLAGRLSQAELASVEDECVLEIIRMQEEVGLQTITDGDFRRGEWLMDFLLQLSGLRDSGKTFELPFSGGVVYRAPIIEVTGKIGWSGDSLLNAFQWLQSRTGRVTKVCIPAPAMVYTMIAPRRVARDVYADIGELWADLGRAYRDAIAAFAAAGCRYLQIDDVNSASLTDPNRRAFWQSLGHDPEDLLRAFVEINNAGLEARPPSMTVGVHMCRGNYQSQWAGEGGYDFVAERYFSSLDVDGFLLEYDDERSGGFDPLRFVPEDKFVILGILTSKQPELEPREALRRKIDEASKYVPTERLGIGPQCGFASTHHGNLLTEKDQRCKLAYAVEIATEVWGGV